MVALGDGQFRAQPVDVGIESTVVDACGDPVVLLRPGGITVAQLEAVVGPVVRAQLEADAAAPQPSPGTSLRHYAPRARLVEVERDAAGQLQLPATPGAGETWALLAIGPGGDAFEPSVHHTMPDDAAGFARRLFAALHEIDRAGCAVAYVERIPDGAEWEAVADRLRRAGLEKDGGSRS